MPGFAGFKMVVLVVACLATIVMGCQRADQTPIGFQVLGSKTSDKYNDYPIPSGFTEKMPENFNTIQMACNAAEESRGHVVFIKNYLDGVFLTLSQKDWKSATRFQCFQRGVNMIRRRSRFMRCRNYNHRENFTGRIFPGDDGPIPSPGWEGMREWIEDWRYMYRLEQLIDKAGQTGEPQLMRLAEEAREMLEDVLKEVDNSPTLSKKEMS